MLAKHITTRKSLKKSNQLKYRINFTYIISKFNDKKKLNFKRANCANYIAVKLIQYLYKN